MICEVFVEELRELVQNAPPALVQNATASDELNLLLNRVQSSSAAQMIEFIRNGITGATAQRKAVVKMVPHT